MIQASPKVAEREEAMKLYQEILQLVPKDEPETEFGLPVKPVYTRGDIMRVLGLTEHQFNHQLAKGLIARGTHERWGKMAWSLDELRAVVAAWTSRELPYRWGLPKKAFNTTGDLVQILGPNFERIRYLIEARAITDCKGRDERGHRWWTEAEVERAVEQLTVTSDVTREEH